MSDIQPESETPPWKKNFSKKRPQQDRKKDRDHSLETAFSACGINDKVTVQDMAEYLGVTEKTVRNRLKEHGGFWVDGGQVGKK